MSECQRSHASVLLMQVIYLELLLGKAKGDGGCVAIEGSLSCCEVIRKHNEFIITLLINRMDKDRFLSLCDPHNSIIHQFGCEGSCTRPAAICLKGCNQYQHQQKASKHDFLPAKQLYTVVGSVREKYSSFKANFRDVYLKRYIDEVMACVESFETYILGEFLEKNPMIDIFCKYTSGGDLFQQAIEDPLDELEFAELKCREVFHLRHFQQMLQRQGPEEQEKRMIRLLSKIFQYHLRSQKILLPQKGPTERKMRNQELLELDRIEALPEALNRKVTNLQYSQRQEKVEELLLLLRSDMKEFQRYSQNVDFVGKAFGSLQSYMERVQPQKLILAVNFPLSPSPFWDKFTQLITNKGLKQVSIYTTTDLNSSNAPYQAEIFKRHENSLPISIQHSAKWQQISTLIDKRADR